VAEGGIEEMARRGYAAWNDADVDGALATMHEDVVYVTSGVFPGMRERYEGREEVREFFGDFGGPWEKVDVLPVRVETLDEDHLLVEVRFHARGRAGIEVERTFYNLLAYRDGLLAAFRGFAERDDALAAARATGGSGAAAI
jgi:ketosteroid isomerase-like protein